MPDFPPIIVTTAQQIWDYVGKETLFTRRRGYREEVNTSYFRNTVNNTWEVFKTVTIPLKFGMKICGIRVKTSYAQGRIHANPATVGTRSMMFRYLLYIDDVLKITSAGITNNQFATAKSASSTGDQTGESGTDDIYFTERESLTLKVDFQQQCNYYPDTEGCLVQPIQMTVEEIP